MTMRLSQPVHDLTRPHQVAVNLDDGSTTYVTEASLLNQLREAISSSSGRGGGRSSKNTVPISVEALELYQTIANKAQEFKANFAGKTTGTLESIIQQWSLAATKPLDAQTVEKTVADWCRKIRHLLDPPQVIEINAPCPSCGNRQVINEDKEINLCLTFTAGTITCAVCLTTWTGSQLWELRDAIDAATKEPA